MFSYLLYILSLIIVMTISIPAQPNWIAFHQQTKTKPSIILTSSDNSNVSFTVQINGMYAADKKNEAVIYRSLSIPDGELIIEEGSPQLPMISKLIAIPDCDDVSFSLSPSNKIEFTNYNILPAPKYQSKKWQDDSGESEEVFEENKTIYSANAFFPGKYGKIEIGYVRDQKVARVTIYPVQFNDVSINVNVFTDFNINLSFINPKSPVNKELGIFRNMMHHVALNYEPSGISAETKLQGTENNNQLNKASSLNSVQGSVTRVTNLSTLVGINAIPVDYLIITHSSLFNSNSLTTLANRRMNFNGYDVAIVRVDPDIYNYKPGRPNYQSVRDFVADVYNDGRANHTGDGHLGYILLVGDADNASNPLVPAEYQYLGFAQAGDYYYACLTHSGSTYDDDQDLMYGRLAVDNETDLSNNVNKIISYESNSSGSWNEHYTFVAGSYDLFNNADPNIRLLTQVVPPTCQKSYGYRELDTDPNTVVTEANPIFGQRFTYAEYQDDANLCGSRLLNDWLYDNASAGINNGIHTFVYEGHGSWRGLIGEGCGRQIFKVEDCLGTGNTVQNRLNNNFYSFMMFIACETGHFDTLTYGDCVAEVVENLENRGSIGILASTRSSYASAFGVVDRYILEAQYSGLSHIMGEAIMESKLRLSNVLFRRQYNLYGDPAVNLWPTGFTMSENTTLSGTVDISTNITVPAGITLTIEPNSTVTFTNGASLIVNNYGTLTANGTSSQPITFDFTSPNSTTANGIKFIASTSMGTINYCQIRNAYRGVYEYQTVVNITNSAVSGCYNGIYLSNSSPTIQYCNLHNNANAGVYSINYASPYLYNNYMTYNYYGVYCISNSDPKFGNNSTQGKNRITDNYCGVYCYNNSHPVLGQSSPPNGGYNNFVNAAHNIDNGSSGTVYANHIYWGTTPPGDLKIYGSGTTSYTDYLSSSVTISPAPPLSKTNSELYTSENSVIPMLSELDKAYELLASNNLADARTVCLNLINNYPDYSVSYNALNLLKETYSDNEITAKKDIYTSMFNKKSKKDLYAIAGLILSDIDKDNKLKHIDEVITDYKGESVIELALFDKFVYYYFDMNDVKNSRDISNVLDSQFPSQLVQLRLIRYSEMRNILTSIPNKRLHKKPLNRLLVNIHS